MLVTITTREEAVRSTTQYAKDCRLVPTENCDPVEHDLFAILMLQHDRAITVQVWRHFSVLSG